MNYLEMVQAVVRRSDSGAEIPTSVRGAEVTLETAQFADWVNDVWIDVQNAEIWRWMKRSYEIPLQPGKARYGAEDAIDTLSKESGNEENLRDGVNKLGSWFVSQRDTYISSNTNLNSFYELLYLRWNRWREHTIRLSSQTGRPFYFTIDPQEHIQVYPTPPEGNNYSVIKGEYKRQPQTLELDGDEPQGLKPEHHNLLVYGALEKYGVQQSVPEIFELGAREKNRYMRQLRRDQLQTPQLVSSFGV